MKRIRFELPLVLCIGLLAASGEIASACLWDYDTLQQERSRFPDTLELITGKFLRHGEEFYNWRIEDRQTRLDAGESSPELYDDIAVALDKLGRSDEAIEWMEKKESLFPGLYETLANQGTFHIHAGRLEEGVEYIERALEVNPDAHFGRERFQLHLVRYVLENQDESGNLALPIEPDLYTNVHNDQRVHGFAEYLAKVDPEIEMDAALKGIEGMMRFGHHDSPVLLEVVGDLLLAHEETENAKQLAARAYLKAAYEADDSDQKRAYIAKATEAIVGQYEVEIRDVIREFNTELADADSWFAELEEQESLWTATVNMNPDEEFSKLYAEAPVVQSSIRPDATEDRSFSSQSSATRGLLLFAVVVVGVVALLAVVVIYLFTNRKSNESPIDPFPS